MASLAVTLDDKYVRQKGRIFLTGTQALVRLPLMQRDADLAAGLDTGGFISGYRGSPLGGFDQALWAAKAHLQQHRIVFQPGVNEDLGATAVWGSQQTNLYEDATCDGVFGLWYGKGPGVDRCGDVLKHGNAAGSSRHGGVLLLAGDDHASKSSTLPHQSEYAFIDASIPALNPAGIQDVLDLGLHGWAMSRFSGCWVALKTITEMVDSGAVVDVDPGRVTVRLPDADAFAMPHGGLNIRWPDKPLEQEQRLFSHKLAAVRAYVRANGLDRVTLTSPTPRLGIVTAGKSFLDVAQAFDDLGITPAEAAALGITIYKVAVTWPLEPEGVRRFAAGLEEILVVEEKRPVLEDQLRTLLYDLPAERRPRIVGKTDESGVRLLPATGEQGAGLVARVIAGRLKHFHTSPTIEAHLATLEAKARQIAATAIRMERTPFFCSGCPHNTSTRVPAGSRATAGIGCHYMVTWMDRQTDTFTQMGGEGVPWIGQAPFTRTPHIFTNLGDGTYFHSGILAIRAAVAAGVNITYKLLFNDAVAMTGGQPVDGTLTVPDVLAQIRAEGVRHITVVSDDPGKYAAPPFLIPGDIAVHDRSDLDQVQRNLRELPGVSVLLYDQTCAAEKRRRRKRGRLADPAKRVFINEAVCEGCGDCSRTSHCLSVTPLETEFGTKRVIDQSSCNKDYSCVEGFCPSFVTVEGGSPRRRRAAADLPEPPMPWPVLPDPTLPALDRPWSILIAGVGGTGIVTVGALIAMAAHVEGKGCTTLDMTGLAQKGGAVHSHVRIAADPGALHAVRIAEGDGDVLLGCDLVVAAGAETLARLRRGSRAVVNTAEAITSGFVDDPDLTIPAGDLKADLAAVVGKGDLDLVDAGHLATALLGDSIAVNPFLLGYAYQKGLIPVSAAALDQAIELNGVAVPFNRAAFTWGRRAAEDLQAVTRIAVPEPGAEDDRHLSLGLDELIERRAADLVRYQDIAYAARYRAQIAALRAAEGRLGRATVTEAASRSLYKLMAYKDEYEVARLYSDGAFQARLAEAFEGDYSLRFHLAPPAFARRDPTTGHLRKRSFGPWMMRAFGLLARLKGLRGTAFDPFGRTQERRDERRSIVAFEALLAELTAVLSGPEGHARHPVAAELAALPLRIRGFGHVKEAAAAAVRVEEAALLARLREPVPAPALAAE